MLARTADLPGNHVEASVMELPFPYESFDVVVSAWVIETVSEPALAVQEYRRVLKPDGHVLYTFCSLPQGWFSRAGSAWLRSAVMRCARARRKVRTGRALPDGCQSGVRGGRRSHRPAFTAVRLIISHRM